jgi:hypothetical protein
LILNSAYGKFATNPRKFNEVKIVRVDKVKPDENVVGQVSIDKVMISSKIDDSKLWKGFRNVAIAASITGAVRSILMRAIIPNGKRVLYCDTDCVVVKGAGKVHGVEEGPKLGQWELEGVYGKAALSGKKFYGLYEPKAMPSGKLSKEKVRIKGVQGELQDVLDVINGKKIIKTNIAPTFYMKTGLQAYIQRELKPTIKHIFIPYLVRNGDEYRVIETS